VLPEAMRFLAGRTGAAQARLAEALGVAGPDEAQSAAAAADAVAKLVADLGLPARLSETSAIREELPLVAAAIHEELR
ncbi:MAG: iron-containing alcohol dehydrogenase, partial [Akkermansiaceae bacterium]|nr:iron-containing alcohol dehydrogenase [Akkermansiaceae bacterium]